MIESCMRCGSAITQQIGVLQNGVLIGTAGYFCCTTKEERKEADLNDGTIEL